jgi:iron(III) transport system substrate-binding protein
MMEGGKRPTSKVQRPTFNGEARGLRFSVPASAGGKVAISPYPDLARTWFFRMLVMLAGVGLLTGCARTERPEVVVYTSQDQEYSELILRDFTRETGIDVRAVYDSEAVKTVGLANRLLAERKHPQCDVFWSNEELRTRLLAAREVFDESGWQAFGYRSRRLVINTNLIAAADAPKSVSELTNRVWRGKVALAFPMFGTTATHFLALRQEWGAARWQGWCRALVANQPLVVDGNSVVVKLVGKGEAAIGLTDADDIQAGRREGLPVAALPLQGELLLIPNTVGIVRGAPHPVEARQLVAYLQRPEVLRKLVTLNALEGADASTAGSPTLRPQWNAMVAGLEAATAELKEIFLR